MKKNSLSVVIITYNEADCIARCIESTLAVADEVIVVDSFSTDDTVVIAKAMGAKVVQHKFEGHIAQKNYAASLATKDYILSLDADEMLSDALRESIAAFLQQPDAISCKMNRLNNYCGQWIKHGGWYPDRKLRLWKKGSGAWGGINPHDRFAITETNAKITTLSGDILHYSYASIAAHISQSENFAKISAASLFVAGKKANLINRFISPAAKFVQDYIFKMGFLDGKNGWEIALISAKATSLKYYYLYKLQSKK